MTAHDLPAGLGKPALRAWARTRRAEAARREGADHAQRLALQVMAHVPLRARETVAGYVPVHGEADPMALLEMLAARGHAVALPYVRGKGMALGFRRWQPGDELVPGAFGIPEPLPRRGEIVPGVVLVPGLWFDRAGARLGYGGGFYDRTLAALRRGRRITAVGLAHEGQAGGYLPAEAHDAPVDWVVTARRVWRVRRN